MEEKEEGGISIGDIFRTIFSQKWLALIITAVITVVGTVGIYFYGSTKVDYSVSFVLRLPNTGDATAISYTYPDGERFYFTDIISRDNLKKVAERTEFSSIDVDSMVRGDNISIKRTVDEIYTDSTEGVYDLNYTIKVKAKYFNDEDSARRFIGAIAMFPRDYIGAMDINYDQSLTTSKSAITYEEQLNLLRSQTVYIQSKYTELVDLYGSEFIVQDGRTLANCKDEVDSYLLKDLFMSLKNKAKENGFIKSGAEERLKYESELFSKDLQRREAQAALDGLLEMQASGSTIIYDKIIELNREIASLTLEIEYLEKYLQSYQDESKIANADFEAEIAKVEAVVSKFTEDIKPVSLYVYGKVTKVNFLSSKIVEAEGGYSIIMSFVLSFVAALVVAAIVAYIVGYYRLKKSRAVKAEVVVYPEAQLQLAAAKDDEEEEKEDK